MEDPWWIESPRIDESLKCVTEAGDKGVQGDHQIHNLIAWFKYGPKQPLRKEEHKEPGSKVHLKICEKAADHLFFSVARVSQPERGSASRSTRDKPGRREPSGTRYGIFTRCGSQSRGPVAKVRVVKTLGLCE